MHPAVFQQVVSPLLGMGRVTLLGISTPDKDEDNYYTQLMQARDEVTNRHYFKNVVTQLPCKRCRMFKRPTECEDTSHMLPRWKAPSRMAMLNQILASQSKLHSRENMGVLDGEDQSVFARSAVLQFFEQPEMPLRHDPGVVYVAIDPSGGGSLSDYAILSMVREQDHLLVR